jgi:hypothetical protein
MTIATKEHNSSGESQRKARTSTERVRALRDRRRAAGDELVSLYLPKASVQQMRELASRFKKPLAWIVAACLNAVWKNQR